MKYTNEQQLDLRDLGVYIHGYKLQKTCSACPEQYDVYNPEGKQVAYIRLRHGFLRVDVPDCGHTIYSTERVHGDGIFDNDERFKKLTECIEKMIEWYLNEPWIDDDPWVDNIDPRGLFSKNTES